MKAGAVILPLLCLSAFAQQPSPITLIGTIQKVSRPEIRVRSRLKSITLYSDDRTTASRDTVSRDLSLLRPGDEISIRYAKDSSGKLIVSSIWAKVTTFRGVVKQVTPGGLLVDMDRSVPLTPAPKAMDRVVHIYLETEFTPGHRRAAEGQQIEIVGLDLGNGEVDAVRIAIYNTDLPAQWGSPPEYLWTLPRKR